MAAHYMSLVLLKEDVVFHVCLKTGMLYEEANERCSSTERVVKKQLRIPVTLKLFFYYWLIIGISMLLQKHFTYQRERKRERESSVLFDQDFNTSLKGSCLFLLILLDDVGYTIIE